MKKTCLNEKTDSRSEKFTQVFCTAVRQINRSTRSTEHTGVMSHKMMSSCCERGRNPRSMLMIWVKCASNFAAVHKEKDASLLKAVRDNTNSSNNPIDREKKKTTTGKNMSKSKKKEQIIFFFLCLQCWVRVQKSHAETCLKWLTLRAEHVQVSAHHCWRPGSATIWMDTEPSRSTQENMSTQASVKTLTEISLTVGPLSLWTCSVFTESLFSTFHTNSFTLSTKNI